MTDNTYIEETESVKKTPFQSPVPFIIKLRNLIFGKKRPDAFTQVTFYLNLIIWASFFIWNILSYFAISSREFIWQKKGIPVEAIIEKRGSELNFSYGEFLDRLETFHSISVILWAISAIGLILLYRKNKRFIYFAFTPVILFVMMNIFYLSWRYFMEDTTAFDKIALIVFFLSLTVYSYLLKEQKEDDGEINFFGVAEEDEPDYK